MRVRKRTAGPATRIRSSHHQRGAQCAVTAVRTLGCSGSRSSAAAVREVRSFPAFYQQIVSIWPARAACCMPPVDGHAQSGSGCILIGAWIHAAHTPVTFVTHTPAPTLAVQVSEIRCLSHRPAPGACVSSNGAAKGEQVESNISYRGAGMRACPSVPQGRSSRTRSRSGWVQDDMGA